MSLPKLEYRDWLPLWGSHSYILLWREQAAMLATPQREPSGQETGALASGQSSEAGQRPVSDLEVVL